MLIEGPKFRLWLAPDLSREQWNEAAEAICRILVDPPQSACQRRAEAVRKALSIYQGAPSARAKELERQYRSYLARGWLRERDFEKLPAPHSTERDLLHRLARCNAGASLSWRQLLRIAATAIDHDRFESSCPDGLASLPWRR